MLSGDAGPGQTLTQAVINGSYNNNRMSATMTASDQQVTQRIIRTEVGSAVTPSPVGQRSSSNNDFTIETDAAGARINASWGGYNGVIDITQTAAATAAAVTWTGYGSFVAGSPPLLAQGAQPVGGGASVTISQTGANNVFTGVTTANPGQVLNVNVTQN